MRMRLRKRFDRGVLAAAVVLAACAFWAPARRAARAAAANRPNVVLIMTDDQGFGDLGVHGNRFIHTPNIDRFAREGVELTRFYVSPVCAPTRASLMTGRYYYRTGVIHTSRGGAKMHGGEATIAERLRGVGYATGIFGKWHLGDNFPMRPQDQGFQTSLVHKSGGIGQAPDKPNSYFDPLLWKDGEAVRARGYCTDVFTNAAIDFIEAHRDRPFFVYLPTNAPHAPLEISPSYVQPYLDQGLDETTAKVYGMCENIDENVGKLLAALDRLRLRENTLVIFLTDNGPQQQRYNAGLRGRKSWVYEGGIRVPCFVQWPAQIQGGRKVPGIAAHIDLSPTILDACGAETAPPAMDGRSLLPALRGDAPGVKDRILFFQCHRGLAPERYHNAAAITQQIKLVMNPGTFGDESLQGRSPVFELYDLAADPAETKNLAAAQPERTAKLRAAYDRWYDDVRATRNFAPGRIVIGSPGPPRTHLCRYQDGTFVGGFSQGWSVEITASGDYRMKVVRREEKPGRVFVSWLGETTSFASADGTATATLRAGKGLLDIWFVADGGTRDRPGDNSTIGDVIMNRVR